MLEPKSAQASLTTMTEMVFPNDTNTLGNLMGGNLMRLIDIVGAICAQKHANRIAVTASLDSMSFVEPIPLGNVITLQAKVTRAFNSSMEVRIEVWAENIPEGKKITTNQAFMTFVAVNKEGKPAEIPAVIPETEEEKEMYMSALRRRQLRLVLGGRMKPEEATELKALFGI